MPIIYEYIFNNREFFIFYRYLNTNTTRSKSISNHVYFDVIFFIKELFSINKPFLNITITAWIR